MILQHALMKRSILRDINLYCHRRLVVSAVCICQRPAFPASANDNENKWLACDSAEEGAILRNYCTLFDFFLGLFGDQSRGVVDTDPVPQDAEFRIVNGQRHGLDYRNHQLLLLGQSNAKSVPRDSESIDPELI